MKRPNSPFHLSRHRGAAKVCDGTYLAAVLTKHADAMVADKGNVYDLALISSLYALAGDAMHMAAEASKSGEAAGMHRQVGDKLYAKAQQYSPELLCAAVPEAERYV